MYLTFFLVVEYHNFPCVFENNHILKDFPDLRTFLKEPVLAGFPQRISHVIFLLSSSSRSRGGKVRSARGHIAVRALVGEPASCRQWTFWEGR